MSRDNSKLLRYALRADAAFCTLAAIDVLLFTRPLADFLGVRQTGTLTVLGIGLLAWAAHLVVASRRTSMSMKEAWYFVGGGLLWIAGSVAVVVAGPFTGPGNALVAGIAVAVLAFTEAQYLGIRRLRRDGSPSLVRQAA